ncbi:TetR/AcrR family transcriptional regulator [Actinomadura hibisca]|uniref:TetR/AcrR family transcriptional regulator n=1 Tax=Actinomadura hibisca TaxID=68565 RepID=UPI000AC88EEA|nr:TetR/AcrR family transcriptional regulator [Actinomadura hibisca]
MTGADAPMPTPPGRRPRRGAPPRRRLTADLIVTTALGVLDAEGLDAVSMRRVAQELDTGPASLYAHVSGKDELVELMLDRVAGEVELPERPDPARWQEQLKEIAHAGRRVWTAHRDIARAHLGLIPTGAGLLRIADAQLGAMRAGGVPPRIAALAVDALGMLVSSSAIEETAYQARVGEGDVQEHFAQRIGEVREYFGKLPPDRFPNIIAMADELTSGTGEERFAFGLDVLVRGIASHAIPPGTD